VVVSGVSDDANKGANADELRAFVSSTLQAIFDGIRDSQKDANLTNQRGRGASAFDLPREVTFDIAVTAKSIGGKSGKLKLEVFSVGANVGGEKSDENSTVSRVSFAVPFQYREGGF
jgi:hypothetical protein